MDLNIIYSVVYFRLYGQDIYVDTKNANIHIVIKMKIELNRMKTEVGKIGDNAMIKSNGLVSKIKDIYGSMDFQMVTLLFEKEESYIFNDKEKVSSSKKKNGWRYILSNGDEYHEEDLIIGDVNIREFKINQINGI